MNDGLLILCVIALAIIFRLYAGSLDRDRIRDYIRERGGRLLSVNWAPFGTGWFGEKGDRIYEIRYVDAEGNEHHATCKTRLLSGVYFTEDRIVRHARPPAVESSASTVADLERENRQLREELERLKNRQG